MKRSENVFNVLLTKKENTLQILISGWYIPDSDKEYSIVLEVNGKSHDYSIERLYRKDKREELYQKGLDTKMKTGFLLTADVDYVDIKKIALVVNDTLKLHNLVELDAKDVIYTLETSKLRYNIDKIWVEKTGDERELYKITGWAVANSGTQVTIDIRDSAGKTIPFNYMHTERLDLIDNGYTENKEEAKGFAISFPAEYRNSNIYFMTPEKNIIINISKEEKRQKRVYEIDKWKRFVKAATPHNIANLITYIKDNGTSNVREHIYNFLYGYMDQPEIYRKWFKINKVSIQEMEKQKTTHFEYEPMISIIVPTYNTPIAYLKEMIESVKAQTYAKWQLCIADGSCGNKDLESVLKEYSEADSRIQYVLLENNRGIAGNTNAALEMAVGDITALLDHDDTLEPDALYEIVKAFQEDSVDVVYTDEDKILGPKWINVDPNFKPDFNIDLLRSHNYITHFYCVKTRLIKETGGFHEEYDGAQDYDIILRTTENARKIRHVARILYHWRMHANSTAANPASKAYCHEAGRKAVEDHLKRLDIPAKVELSELFGGSRVIYDVKGNPLVSVIIPNKDHIDDLNKCIESLMTVNSYKNIEVIVVENNSTDEGTFKYYESIKKKYENVHVITWKREFNYSAINNYGVKNAKGDYVLLLNNDTEIIAPDSIKDMLGYCMREDVGIVGAKLLYPDGTIQHAGVIVGLGGIAGHAFVGLDADAYGYMSRAYLTSDYSAVTAACLMVSKEIYNEVGGLSEEYAVAFNDVDFCMKVRRKGYLVVYDAFSQWYHYESKSRGYEDTDEKQARFKGEIATFESRWHKELEEGDPYYNRNFPMNTDSYTLQLD